jgi:ubiquinone/menaquinone biosynthesis C-methylase UbiE
MTMGVGVLIVLHVRIAPLTNPRRDRIAHSKVTAPLARFPADTWIMHEGEGFTHVPTKDRTLNVEVFNQDASSTGGYLYATNDRLSCRLATQRQRDSILSIRPLSGCNVLDIGCGDGFNTMDVWDRAHPNSMTAIDPAEQAIAVANMQKGDREILFEVANAHTLPYPDDSFDVAMIEVVLHHDDDAADIIREAFRVAPEIIVLEPNGNNLGLKVIEKASAYHRAHHEKSYRPRLLRSWVERSGGTITRDRFVGFVPIFCPDWFARCTKAVEPIVERTPLVRAFGCALYVFVARRAA